MAALAHGCTSSSMFADRNYIEGPTYPRDLLLIAQTLPVGIEQDPKKCVGALQTKKLSREEVAECIERSDALREAAMNENHCIQTEGTVNEAVGKAAQPPSLFLSLEGALPPAPPCQAPSFTPKLSPVSPSVQVSLCASLPPPMSPSLPAWQPAFAPPLLPPSLPPMHHSHFSPPTLPPSLPAALSYSWEEAAPPCWDASAEKPNMDMEAGSPIHNLWGSSAAAGYSKHAGVATPTTCSGSEHGSLFSFHLDDKALHSSSSETDSVSDSKNDAPSTCMTPVGSHGSTFAVAPPPGLELPMELQLGSMLQEKARTPVRALCLDGLL